MIVVANSGPLMALGKLGLIYLLHPLYDSVLIPSGVYQEVVIAGLELEQPDAYAVRFAVARGEIIVVNLENADLSQAVQVLPIHRGEKQAIQLGLNKTADWVLLDDQLVREHAQRSGLKVKGTLGIIVEAYHQRQLAFQEVELVLQTMLNRGDIWISDVLIRRVWDRLRSETSQER